LLVLIAAFCFGNAFAEKKESKKEQPSPTPELKIEGLPAEKAAEFIKKLEAMRKIESELKFQQGVIPIGKNLAKITLPENFRYLDPDNTEKVLVDIWGNPPRNKSLGMIVPADFKATGENSWGVIVTYEEDGHVKDNDAASINYNDLLKQMQEGTREANEERKKAGYEAIELVGWAESPHYDKTSHKLYWAKELKFGDNDENTLNYDIRALGRRGVLSLNAVAAMSQLKDVEKDMQAVLGFVEFNEGHRYKDYVDGTDKVAAYGVGALIAGGLAAKAGLFKVLLAGLLAFKKFAILAVIGIVALLKKLLGKKSSSGEEPISITNAE
jgi:uncharacterized membrane-anchored protein